MGAALGEAAAVAVRSGERELKAQPPLAPENDPVRVRCVDLRGRADGVVASPAVASRGHLVQAGEVPAQCAPGLADGRLQVEVLQHDPARFAVRAVADRARDADGLRARDLFEPRSLGGEHLLALRGVELDEVSASAPAHDMAFVDAAAAGPAAGLDRKGHARRRADGALDFRPGIHEAAASRQPSAGRARYARDLRALAIAAFTRTGAVPPRWVRLLSEPSSVSTSATSLPIADE